MRQPPGTKGGFCAPRASQGRTVSRRLYAVFDGFDEVKSSGVEFWASGRRLNETGTTFSLVMDGDFCSR
jgi:hypothetical protein